MSKKIVGIITIISFSVVLYGMEPKKKTMPKINVSLRKSDDSAVTKDASKKDILKKNDSGKVLSGKNGKRSIRSLSDVSQLRDYRDKSTSLTSKDESSEKK